MANRKEYPNCAIKSPERAKEEALMIAALRKKKEREKEQEREKRIGRGKRKEKKLKNEIKVQKNE